MRLLWLRVCVLAVFLPGGLAAQHETGPAFDPKPVVLPKSDSGSGRSVTNKDLLSIREFHGLSISPDGQRIAFVVGQADYKTNSYRSGLFLVRTEGRESPVCLGSAGEPHWSAINEWASEQPKWSRDSHNIFYRMRMRQDERWQVWRWGLKPGSAKPLTHVPGDVVSYDLDRSGQKLIMKVDLPISSAAKKQILERGILYDNRILPWQGMPALTTNLTFAARKSEIWVHDLNSGVERRATSAERDSVEPDIANFQKMFDGDASEAKCRIGSVEWAPSGKTALVSCSFESEHPGIMRWRMFVMWNGGQRRFEVDPDSIRVTDHWWSKDGAHLYFVSTKGDGHPGEIRVANVASGEVRTVFRPAQVLREFSMDSADRWIACTYETNTSPAKLAVIDSRNGAMPTLTDPNPEFRHLKLNSVERISGVNRYGEDWFGQLVKPVDYDQRQRYPLIVTLYRSGDGFLLAGTGDENPIQVYASYGFVVLSFDIGRNRERRHGDFDDYLLNWASPTASLEMAVHSLVDGGIVDPTKVGLAGFSHGTEILEYAISHTHMFRAAIESGPAARDPYFYYMAGTTWHELFATWGLGGWPEGESRKNWQALAASLRADQIETPLLVNAADSEFIASLALYTSLEELHKPVELYIYANELHAKNQPKHRYEIFGRNLDWFRYWLRNEEDISADKKEQYLGWRRLRDAWTQRPEQLSQPQIP